MSKSQLLKEKLLRAGIYDSEVLDAIAKVPREQFIPNQLSHQAYEDSALPITHGQTISQPYVVALMTEKLLSGGPCHNILEVGTGSGYQAAILAELVDNVYTTERIQELSQSASERLQKLGYDNVTIYHCDGSKGLPEHAPYDGIMVTAAASEVPKALLGELKDNARMVIPVGPPGCQDLLLITRQGSDFKQKFIEKVVFVPLLGDTQ